jgi:hypothetical protein
LFLLFNDFLLQSGGDLISCLSMKLTLNPSFSTTYIHNPINSKVTVDTSYRKVISAAKFNLPSGEPRLTLNVKHPLQEGHTTYFLNTPEDIQKGLDYCIANNIEIHKL